MTPQEIDAYIAAFPPPVRKLLNEVREAIRRAAPDADEAIRYRMPTFRLRNKNLVHFAGHTHHIGFYPMPSAIEVFSEELSGYKSAKGSVQFPLEEPMPIPLIQDIVRFRVAELTAR